MSVIKLEVQQSDVENAKRIAEKTDVVDAPLMLVGAMIGKTPSVAGVPDNLVTDTSPNEEESPVKGLILSKEHIVKIKTYVATGIIFPVDEAGVKTFLKYDSTFDSNKYPQISPASFKKLFSSIKGHCSLWSSLEADIKKTGTSLKIFGEKFVITGTDIINVVDTLPIVERVKQLGKYSEKYSVPFGEEDKMICVTLLEMLDILKEAVTQRQTETNALLKRITSFRETMDNEIVPNTASMNSALKDLELSGERASLINRREELTGEIEALDKAYKDLCGYAFTGAAGLALGPVGIISWAITGGIFGAKAEKTRKERNEKTDELAEINRKLEAISRMISFVAATMDKMQDISVVINDAVTGIQNLEVLWDSVAQYIDDSLKQLSSLNETSALLVFSSRMKAAVNSWKNVRDITGELVKLFEAAAKEAIAVAEKAAKAELAKGA